MSLFNSSHLRIIFGFLIALMTSQSQAEFRSKKCEALWLANILTVEYLTHYFECVAAKQGGE